MRWFLSRGALDFTGCFIHHLETLERIE